MTPISTHHDGPYPQEASKRWPQSVGRGVSRGGRSELLIVGQDKAESMHEKVSVLKHLDSEKVDMANKEEVADEIDKT